MKILLVANGFPPANVGGVEIYTDGLAKGLARRGHQVTVFCRVPDYNTPDYRILRNRVEDIQVIRVVNDHKRSTTVRERFVDGQIDALFEDLLSELTPDLIHFNHLIALSAHLPLIADQHRIPSLITLHDYWPICHRVLLLDWQRRVCPGPQNGGDCAVCVAGGIGRQKASQRFNWVIRLVVASTSPQLRARLRWAFSKRKSSTPLLLSSQEIFEERYDLFKKSVLSTQRILVPSNYVRSQFSANGYPSQDIEILPLGVTPLRRLPKPESETDTITFAAIGSVIPIKGIDILVRAFRNAARDNIRLEIHGHELLATSYTRILKQLAQGDKRIHFKGSFHPEQREQIYNNIDILVIPSISPETFSLVAREALSLGKPVIASRVGALPEAVIDQTNGLLFEPGDVQGLTDLLLRIGNQPQLLSQLHCPGPTQIPTEDQHIQAIENIYSTLLS